MTLATCLGFAFGVSCWGSLALAASYTGPRALPGDHDPDETKQNNAPKGVPEYLGIVGGEDIPNATIIPSLPYADTGNTCGFLDDYDEECPFRGSTSPDVVYEYTPARPVEVDIILCDSSYDTKLYVYENDPATLVACSDDACGPTIAPFRSFLDCVLLSPGNTYYIVVDGFLGDCGAYSLEVSEGSLCGCPSGSVIEGEPVCHDDYVDDYNGGCNWSPPRFTSIPCSPSVTVCGTYGSYRFLGDAYRDTDWYEIDGVHNVGGAVWCVRGSLNTAAAVLNQTPGCSIDVVEFQTVQAENTLCFNLPAGDLWLFVATDLGVTDPCGSGYVMAFEGLDCPPVAVEGATWSRIKERYSGPR